MPLVGVTVSWDPQGRARHPSALHRGAGKAGGPRHRRRRRLAGRGGVPAGASPADRLCLPGGEPAVASVGSRQPALRPPRPRRPRHRDGRGRRPAGPGAADGSLTWAAVRRRAAEGGDRAGAAVPAAASDDGRAAVSLDADSKAEILPYIERLTRQVSLPVLYVSHDPVEIGRLTRRVAMMREGKITGIADPAAAIDAAERRSHPWTRRRGPARRRRRDGRPVS